MPKKIAQTETPEFIITIREGQVFVLDGKAGFAPNGATVKNELCENDWNYEQIVSHVKHVIKANTLVNKRLETWLRIAERQVE